MRGASVSSQVEDAYRSDLSRMGLEIERWDSAPSGPVEVAERSHERLCDCADSFGYRGGGRFRDGDRRQTRLVSWTDRQIGVFGTTIDGARGVAIDSVMTKDVLAFAVHRRPVRISCTPVEQLIGDAKTAGLAILFIPRDTAFKLSGAADDGFQSFVILVEVDYLTRALRGGHAALPSSLKSILERREPALHTRPLSPLVKRAVDDILAEPTEEPLLPGLQYQGMTCDTLCDIMNTISREDQRSDGLRSLNNREGENLSRVRAMIEENPTVDYSIEQLGRVAAMNRTKLRQLFKQVYGMTISQFRTAERMQQASALLRQGNMTISQIGYEVGYADTSSFIVAFKNHFGFSPGRARRTASPASPPYMPAPMAWAHP